VIGRKPRYWVIRIAVLALVSACGKAGDSGLQPKSYPVTGSSLTAVWANEGGDKVTREELRATANAAAVRNRIWDGATIRTFGARNEVVSLNLVLEAGRGSVADVRVSFDRLAGPGGAVIASGPAGASSVFSWTGRNIELFLVRYLQIKGLSSLSYGTYDERHVPKRMRRPWSGAGNGTGGWVDRPDHDRFYPEIAVPLELVNSFTVAAGQSQSVWADVYIPKSATPGTYTGSVTVTESGATTRVIPVELTVKGFQLPDTPASKTMLVLSYGNVSRRYTGVTYPNAGTAAATLNAQVRDRHFMVAHRHKISLIDDNDGSSAWGQDAPRPEWQARLSGNLFTAANGYDGPGVGVGNGVFSIGTYSTWNWKAQGQAGMQSHSDAWETWFQNNSPQTERFLYLIDESTNYAQIQQWADWLDTNPGPGRNLMSFATMPLPSAVANTPALDIAAGWMSVGDTTSWENAAAALRAQAGKRVYMYNGKRPASGSFATEDDGVALRQLAWGQFKKRIDRWFFWESSYYNDTQSGRGQNNVFQTAVTFGSITGVDAVRGETGWNHSNGDGVLFYPGIDTVFPAESYGLAGPIASLRLKLWRRGIQDVDYVALARAIDPARTDAIVSAMVPKAMWEYGVTDQSDPTWVRSDVSWSTNPDDWEAARAELAAIIEGN
jgi:hypothetical protein